MSAAAAALADVIVTGLIEYALAMKEYNRVTQQAQAEGRELTQAEMDAIKAQLGTSRAGLEAELARREQGQP